MVKNYHLFDYKKFNNLKFNFNILDLYTTLNKNILLVSLKMKDFPLTLSILENIAKRASLRTSNLLDGVVNTYDTFSSIYFDKNYPFKYDNEFEILGYKEAYEYILENFQEINLDVNFIKKLHNLVFAHLNIKGIGEFRKTNKLKVILNKNMYSKTIYKNKFLDYKLIEEALNNLCKSFNDSKVNLDKLLLIPIFINDFLNISPFNEGNGRISRLLIFYLLLKNNYEVVKYISFDKSIELNQEIFFNGLKRSSIKWDKSLNSPYPVIYSFLYVLNESYKQLLKEFNIKESLKYTNKNKVLELIKRNYYPISKSEIQFMLPNVNISTIESSLYELCKEHKIIKYGTTKDAKYLKIN